MKRIFRLFFIMILTMSFGIVYAEDVTIDKVIEAFNTGDIAEQYNGAGGSAVATYDTDSVDIVITVEGQTYNVSYNLLAKCIDSILNNTYQNFE